MNTQTPFKRLVLRAVLRNVSPMVIRVLAVPDYLDLPSFDEVFRTILGWDGFGYIFRVHGQEFNSFRRATRSKTLCDFQLRLRETFLYTCGAIDLWEWSSGFWTSSREMMTTRCRYVWAAAALLLRNIAVPHRISAVAEAATARRGDVHTCADGSGDGNALRCRS